MQFKNKATRLSLAVATLLCATSASAYNDFSARSDCLGKVVYWGPAYSNAHDIRADETGYNSYNVTGLVNDKNGSEHRFDCRVENREGVSWNVNSGNHGDDRKKKNNKALAIGAGVVGAAALIAILASSKSKDTEHDDKRTEYNAGKGTPFDDMRFLKTECKRVLTAHLNNDHGDVRSLDLGHVNLNDRTLSGDGNVAFTDGDDRNLAFSCSFDRTRITLAIAFLAAGPFVQAEEGRCL